MAGALGDDLTRFWRKLSSICGTAEGLFGFKFSLMLAKLLLPVVWKWMRP
jgi:hypothetical protein